MLQVQGEGIALKNFFLDLVYVQECFAAYKRITCRQYLWGPEKGARSLKLEFCLVLSHHVSAETTQRGSSAGATSALNH